MKIKHLLAGALLGAFASWALAGGVVVKTVQADGVGTDRDAAIRSALTQAVSQANGIRISSDVSRTSKIDSTELDLSGTAFHNLVGRTEIGTDFTSSTAGRVRSYRILKVEKDGNSMRASISADVDVYVPDAQLARKRIAVVPFRFTGEAAADEQTFHIFTREFFQSAVNYLTSSRRFAVIDRDFEDMRMAELNRLTEEDVVPEERVRIGQSVGADYILTGMFTKFDVEKRRKKMPYTDRVVEKTEANAIVMWRLIDVATGQIVLAKTSRVKDSLSEDGLEIFADAIGRGVGEAVLTSIYPIGVLANRDGRLVLTQGGDTMKVGECYRLVHRGALMRDPYTKEQIGREEREVGTVRIVEVSPKSAYAEAVDLKAKLKPSPAPLEYVLRPLMGDELGTGMKAPVKPLPKEPNW